MDGNGRWARARGLPRTAGHRQGAEALREAVEGAAEHGIQHLTVFGFSAENWRRPAAEIDELMRLLRRYLRAEIDELHRNDVRMRVIGDRTRLSRDIVDLIAEGERQTASNTRLTLTVAINYGGRQEIVGAARRLAERAAASEIDPAAIDETVFAHELFAPDVPDPDVVLRTSGEKRLSNFLLWQCAYSELMFLDKLWPDFTRDDIARIIDDFRQRDRRYGATLETR
ncbi:polyprenyl diphosphate synthase [Limimonas halophila]|nr:polyprenyl diphosphate synthase [Limimonas halophila]